MSGAPNIVWISTHDINPHIGPYANLWPGADQVQTPRLSRLAKEGVVFEQAFAAAPVCAPSRSAIMTGCYPTAIGTMHMRTKAVPPPEVRLLSEYFREAGYYTTNNWFTDFQVDTPPTAFDECSSSAHWRDRPEGAPFFAAFHSLITHESRVYRDEDYFAAVAALPEDQRHDPASVELPPYHPDTPAFRLAWARYFDLIAAMDIWVGNILDQLSEDELTDDTLVVFWSDHGASFPRAKRWASEAGLRVPLIMRWPGRIAAGSSRPEAVQMLDLAPTMLEIAGIPVPEHMHGTSLIDAEGSNLAAAPYAFGGRDRMDAQEDTVRTVRDHQYRYVQNIHPDRSGMQYNYYPDHLSTWSDIRQLVHEEGIQLALGQQPSVLTPLQRSLVTVGRPSEELYDLATDPHETVNLIDDPDHQDVRTRLRAALDDWREKYGDLGLVPEAQLLQCWMPNGNRQMTNPPLIHEADGMLTASCSTAGAAIAWTTDPEVPVIPRDPLQEQIGAPLIDQRKWQLYTAPIPAPDTPIWFGAWRLGFDPSPTVEYTTTD